MMTRALALLLALPLLAQDPDKRFPVAAVFPTFRPADLALAPDGKSLIAARFDAQDWVVTQWSLETGRLEKHWRHAPSKDAKARLHRNGKHVILASTRSAPEKKIDPQNNQEFLVHHEFLKVEQADFRSESLNGKKFEVETGVEAKAPAAPEDREALILASALLSRDLVPKGDKSVPASTAKLRPAAWTNDLAWILAGGSQDGNGGLYDARKGALLPLPGPEFGTGQSWTGAFSASGRQLAYATAPGEVAVLDVPKGKPVALKGPAGILVAIGLSKDGTRAAALAETGHLRTWEVKDAKELRTVQLPGPTDRASWIRYTPDDRFLVVAGREAVHVVDAASGEIVRRLGPPPAGRWAVARDADRLVIFSGRLLAGWTLDPPGPTWTRELPEDLLRAWITRDGTRLAVVDTKNRTALLDAATGLEVADYGTGFVPLGAAPDGVIVRGDARVLRLGGTATEMKWEAPLPADGQVALSRDMGLVLHAGAKLTILDAADGKTLGSSDLADLDPVHSELSPDGKTLAILRPGKKELVLVGRDGSGAKVLPLGPKAEFPTDDGPRIAWSGDGKRVLVASRGALHVFGADGREEDAWKPNRPSLGVSVHPRWILLDLGDTRVLASTRK